MIQWIRIKNFKQFDDATIPLGDTVVFVGPNNSGKTSALQALSLWQLGLNRWMEKRGPEFKGRTGVAVNRRDLTSIPVPSGKLIWRHLNVRGSRKTEVGIKTEHVLIEITVAGVLGGREWSLGLTFDYTNEESFYVRPIPAGSQEDFVNLLRLAREVKVAYMPPMSGLAANESLLQPGAVSVLIGQGQTAQVLRNLCFQVRQAAPPAWELLKDELDRLFGCRLFDPVFIQERGEIELRYRTRRRKTELDISSVGRGFQQTLLLLAYICLNERSVLLLDEPDAHLEVLRQRQIFDLIRGYAALRGTQIVAASHSEVILNEAVNTGRVVAFLGVPHELASGPSQLRKALTAIGWQDYLLAEQRGWVLYVEDSTDFRILKAFARLLDHPAQEVLDDPFVVHVGSNIPAKARDHFFGLLEAKPDLVGLALFDRLDKPLQLHADLVERMWSKREIENYFTSRNVLEKWVGNATDVDLFSLADRDSELEAMTKAIDEVEGAQRILGRDIWGDDVKASEDVLDPIFRRYFEILSRPVEFRKTAYADLVPLMEPSALSRDVANMLDELSALAKRARPSGTLSPNEEFN